VDTDRLKASFAQVARHGDAVPTFFYGYLFLRAPELRELFPTSMSAQRDKLVTALGTVVSNVDSTDLLLSFVRGLGRDHRKFGVMAEHYAPVGEALLATLAYYLGDQWTADLSADWQSAYQIVAGEMTAAAQEAELVTPPWWDAPVVAHERRPGTSVAVLTVQPHASLNFMPGQSVGVQSARRPRIWRHYSPANAPRDDHSIELHVRAEPGGWLSPALVFGLSVGDEVRLGPPTGTALTLTVTDPDRDVLMLAGGTGLAPLRAVIEQLAAEADGGRQPRRVTLFHGGRYAADIYDMPALTRLRLGRPWLNVVPVVSDDGFYEGERGTPVQAALRAGRWSDHETFVCGPPAMVADSTRRLADAGVPESRLHVEEFDAHGYIPSKAPTAIAVPAGAR
jgi:NAD(P)H-flavin reductase/hemoglobin-like flavoprotein